MISPDWREFEVNGVKFRINLSSYRSEERDNENIKSLVNGACLTFQSG